jgi:hypothetical protein
MSDTSSSDDEDVLNVYTDVSDDDDDGDTYSRGSTSEIEVGQSLCKRLGAVVPRCTGSLIHVLKTGLLPAMDDDLLNVLDSPGQRKPR